MKMKKRWFFAVMMAMVMTFTSMFTAPVLAASNTSGGNNVQKSTEKELTAAEQEAAAIEKYGYYKGPNAKGIPVLTYHYVVSDAQRRGAYSGTSLAVSRTTFENQMKWLHNRHYRTINCEELYLWHEGKIRLPKKTVMITFDDGMRCLYDNAYPVLKKYHMKGTCFVVGYWSLKNRDALTPSRIRWMQKDYPDFEFQSHTYNMHTRQKAKWGYNNTLKDAEKQKKMFGFEYLAYPYGTFNMPMVRAYRASGIKMAFAYGDNNYALRSQNLYRIRRIKISGNDSSREFTRWFK